MSEADSEIAKASGAEVTFVIPDTESLGKLKELNEKFSLNINYKTKEDWAQIKDKPIRVYFMGFKDIPNEKDEMIKCAVFASESELFIAGQMTLIEAVSKTEPNTPLQITYTGSVNNKTSDGSTMRFDVVTLG